MIKDAEEKGLLKKGATIIEATAGNTGIGLALVGSLMGYKTLLVVPDKMSKEKVAFLLALGAKVILTRSDVEKGHPDYYQDRALGISKEMPNSFYVDQFNNPANPLAHYQTTGPEILEQMNNNVDAVVLGVGSGGTMAGLTRFFKEKSPKTEIVLADPVGSILTEYVLTKNVSKDVGSWLVEGIGEDFIPSIADFSITKSAYSISDEESFETARKLLRTNGILGGSSTGTLIAATLKFCKDQKQKKRIVTFVCDDGSKYLSKMYNDFWMREQGYLAKPVFNDLRDLVSRSYADNSIIIAKPNETLISVYKRMKSYEVSQIPVIENDKIVGIIDETDLLINLHKNKNALKEQVGSFMTKDLKTLEIAASINEVIKLLENDYTVIVKEQDKFYGLITKIDLIDYLRRTKL